MSEKQKGRSRDRIEQALQLLAEEVRDRLDRHPQGHLLQGRSRILDLLLPLPTAARNGKLADLGQDLSNAIQSGLQSLLQQSAVQQPGRVYCLRCQSAHCEHAAPTDSRQVFTGYGPTGLPRFTDFGQWRLALRDPRVDQLYQEAPAGASPLTALSSESELVRDLLPAFYQRPNDPLGYRLHGQVSAGWYRGRDPKGIFHPFAVSFQIVSSRHGSRGRRFGLNVVGVGPGGEPLEALADRMGTGGIPWSLPVRWVQQILATLDPSPHRRQLPPEQLEGRLEGLLDGLARRLDKGFRGQERRTVHAQQRHDAGDRPTRMALADLSQAHPEKLLFDVRRKTLIVLGERGRAHVFNLEGKLVTSIRYTPASIERRRQDDFWRPATADEVATVQSRLEARKDAEA